MALGRRIVKLRRELLLQLGVLRFTVVRSTCALAAQDLGICS